jgi:fructokinase
MQPRVLIAGETLVDFIPATPGSIATVESFQRRAGGAPANVAVGLERLGESPWLCTTLSTDAFGEFLAETLEREGLSGRFVTRVDRPTALAFVSHDPDGEREFLFYREDTADVHLDTTPVDEAALSTVEWVVVGGVTLTVDPARRATFELVERARAAGCRVAFDPNMRPELWPEGTDPTATIERMLAEADLLRATPEDFAPTRVPTDGNFARRLLDRGPDTVLLTEGERGARAVAGHNSPWGHGEWHHPGFEADVVDTTGAGDAFLAGALAALVDGADPAELLAFASAVAAVATTDSGAMSALPDRPAVERFRDRHA